MKICLILEGCYPYVHGGVSTWMHQVITNMPQHEFVLWVIGSNSSKKGKFVYELPKNVVGVQEVFLDDALNLKEEGRMNHRYSPKEIAALKELIRCGDPEWEELFDLYQRKKLNPMGFLKSEEFLSFLAEICEEDYPFIAFSETFHTLRSMLLPVLHILGSRIPEADVYHAICTGYGGLLASMGGYINNKPVLLTEHGIYTREREEEIIRAKWVLQTFKNRWIQFFYMLSGCIYKRAWRVTSLFNNAKNIQSDIGCDPEKCRVIPNGVTYERFAGIPLKEDDGVIDIGAVVRLAPIKDIKTMIYAFFELTSRMPNVRLHIMGGVDDEEYGSECHALVEQLGLKNVIFTGRVNVVEYLEKIDFTILTSISEGQPLSVLESFAAGRPAVTTDVGCCRDLLNGEPGDTLGTAGYCVPPMSRGALADAMEMMCSNRERMLKMGEIGQKRVEMYYRNELMMANYEALYQEVEEEYGRHRV